MDRFAVEGDLTLEAWIRPNQVNGQAQVIHHQSAEGRYLMGLEAADLLSALTFNGTDDVVHIPNQAQLNFAGEITLEAWIKIAQDADTSPISNLVAHGFVDSARDRSEVFLRINQGRYEVGHGMGTSTSPATPFPRTTPTAKPGCIWPGSMTAPPGGYIAMATRWRRRWMRWGLDRWTPTGPLGATLAIRPPV